jgi:outer membrane immunogenic protein
MKLTKLVVTLILTATSFSAAQAADETAAASAPQAAPQATPATSGGLLKDFDTLGGNDVLLDKARALNPEATISIVQDRIVSRRKRLEIAPELANVLGGDAYNSTTMYGINAHYHINPHWSVGAKYAYETNKLRKEGEYLINDTSVTGTGVIPQIDYPKSELMALVNWYPIYGKMNLYDAGVAHFDIYAIGGAGQIQLNSGSTMTYTAGGGLGLWWSQHLTTRAELRYQTYEAQRYTGATRMNLTVAGIQIGYLL